MWSDLVLNQGPLGLDLDKLPTALCGLAQTKFVVKVQMKKKKKKWKKRQERPQSHSRSSLE